MSVSREKSPILGIDIGGTSIKAALVDPEAGKLLGKTLRRSTPRPATAEDMLLVIGEIIEQLNWQGAIGCGFPGIVKKGVILMAANLDQSWIGVNLASELSRLTTGAVGVINDADAASAKARENFSLI